MSDLKMRKVLTLSSPSIPKEQLDMLIETVIQEEGNERMIEWLVNDDGGLDLFVDEKD
jgi:hypothetical protein